MMENLRKVHRLSNSEGGTPETQKLNRETFKSYVNTSWTFHLQFSVVEIDLNLFVYENSVLSHPISCSYRRHSVISLSFRTFRISPKTLKIFTGNVRAIRMEKWPLIFHNWHGSIQIIGVWACAQLTVNASVLAIVPFRLHCKVAVNHWYMQLRWRNSDKKWYVMV